VSIYFQINKKIPLFWNAGISVSELVSSNALQFNNTTGLYYKDNSLFNKTQIGVSTGLDIRLTTKQKRAVSIGPYLYYNITRISNESLYQDRHFNFVGLRSIIILGKK
jgi:hypothetical protein